VTYFAAVFRNQVKYSFKWNFRWFMPLGCMLFLYALACQQEQRPKGILSEKEMVSVLAEIYLVEEKVGRMGIARDSIDKIFYQFKNRIFSNVGVSDSVFIRSMNYYMEHPDKLEQIYTALVDTLSFRAQAAVVLDSAKRRNELSK
jgi:hypothetical protein